MVAARRQKQAQKQQEQQISKALADSKPASNHVSFDDDDDDKAAAPVPEASTANTAALNGSEEEEEDEDDGAPIEVVSNKTSRRQASQDSAKLKAQEKAEKAQRQAAAEKKRLEKRKQKEAEAAALLESAPSDKASDSETIPNEGSSEEEGAGPSNRLDPSLFAEVFARPVSAPRSILKKRSAEEKADEVAKLQKARKLQRQKQRAGGVVKGRDGMPMKRTADGTVLRALNTSSKASANHKTSFDDDEAEPEEPLDSVLRPAPLDPSVSLPNAKARAFKKRTLAKKGTTKATASSRGSSAKPKKSEDDPLGLNDPAFLPGGEFYHLVNKGDKAKGAKQSRQSEQPSARQAYRGGGVRKDAVSALRARSRSGPSLGFARSQQDSDDD